MLDGWWAEAYDGFNGFGIGDTDPILQGGDVIPNTTKVLTWHQCPAEFTSVSASDGTEVVTCDTDSRTDDSTLRDQSWYNPYDVAKGHRGFLDGDFVMFLYAWSPNWRLNAKGLYRYDFGDTMGMTPLVKMHTLGHDFIPPGIHAGGLRYHGVAQQVALGVLRARNADPGPQAQEGRRRLVLLHLGALGEVP